MDFVLATCAKARISFFSISLGLTFQYGLILRMKGRLPLSIYSTQVEVTLDLRVGTVEARFYYHKFDCSGTTAWDKRTLLAIYGIGR